MDFSDIALAKFLQVAPELGPSILNFSELTEEMGDGGDTKTGVFALRIGEGLAFVPVVAKGDNIFPIDSIFIDDESQFRPLTKGTITALMNQSSMAPGKKTKIPQNVDKNPSVYNMINPPRTGKFTYASTSRLTEFLAVMPDYLKKFAFEKISSEKTVYDRLDQLFGLKTIFEVLQTNKGTAASMGDLTAKPVSIITGPGTLGAQFTSAMAQDVVANGYTVHGNPEFSRVAVSYQPFNTEGTYKEVSNSVDGGQDHNIVMRSGTSMEAYLPNSSRQNPVRAETLALFTNGDWATAERFIASGDSHDRETVLKNLFAVNPPRLMRDCNKGDRVVMFTPSGEYIGPFSVDSVVQNHMGTELSVYASGGVRKICGYRNHTQEMSRIGDQLYVSPTVLVMVLGANLSADIERSAHDASRKKELITSQYLGSELNLRYDGVEFSGNGHVWGTKAAAMRVLVEDELLEPSVAETFIKQAELTKSVKIFLSKKASTDFNSAEVPQFGNLAQDLNKQVGINGSFMPAVQEANKLGDGQVLEATIISQLLQVPDLFEYIAEFLPDLSSTVDKLGRILFLTRVKLNNLSENLDPDSVFALVSQIKTVYRQLGDAVEKLKEISTTSKGFEPNKQPNKGNGV